ncbi:MAG TPA: DegT/DnrJ/EryC1/StrS family aminotransferase [Polyangia bacterium]
MAAPLSQNSPRVPITRPQLGKSEADAAARVIRSGWVIQGPEVAAFEGELAAAVGAPKAIAVSSGTAALEIALRALDIGPGDEVITVSHSFIATANAVVAVGATPVFVDVEPTTFGMDPAQLPAALSAKTRAVLCVHQLGIPCDLPAILSFCRAHGLPLVEDAACALGSEIEVDDRWERIGRPHGLIACFSFHPRKIITTGDGGMITTADSALAARMRNLRQHAMSLPTEVRDRDPLAREHYSEPAYNYRMTDISAAVGRPQLARLDSFIADRRRLAAAYAEVLLDHPVLTPVEERVSVRTNWQSYPLHIRPQAGFDQDGLMRFFFERGIACRRGVGNAHQEPAYAGRTNFRAAGPLPVSESLRDGVIMLPLFHGMNRQEERLVRDALVALADAARARR